jgi:phosphodiesterase/alkaline phosphatase D-like protein
VGVDFADLEAALGFSVRPLPDFTPPWITAVGATPGSTTCSIVATASSEPCDIYVQYGTTTSYGTNTATQAATLGQTKTFNLSSLTAATLYHYRVIATDAAGNVMTGRDRTFTTS